MKEQVIEFISSYIGIKNECLSLDTKISDLGLDGDDALEFIESFSDKFNIDLSKFVFNKYFGPEAGFNPFIYIFSSYKLKLFPLTIESLIQAAESGEWLA